MNPLEDHVKLIQKLAAVHMPFGWTEEATSGYLLGLGDLPIDLLRQVVVNSIQNHEGMPSPAKLRREALALTTARRPPPVDEAWQEVVTQLSSVGRNGKPTWSHPLVGQAQKYTGEWFRLCNSEDLKDDRWAFRRAYEDLIQRAERTALTSRGLGDTSVLTGIAAQEMPELGTGEDEGER